ncbi:MAG TPA: 3-isopropylmalate dehydrogenase [Bacteroidales bacterium]|nr:3-isopropylmalate dehydrogenase [Bacteroidales bacterium]
MNLNIAVLPGDGIGPEIIEEAKKVLNAVAKKYNHTFNYEHGLVGAAAIRATGNPFPDETFDLCKKSDAILFGAIGDPEFDNNPKAKVRPEQGLLAMRKKLGLYANIRPITTFKALLCKSPIKAEIIDGVDILVIRELTGGIYFGDRGRNNGDNSAYDTCTYSKAEIVRILHYAFGEAMKRKKHLTVVDKANVLETSRLWRETAQEMASQYPAVHLDFMYVDNAAMQLIQFPKKFDVMVTENMFGDILTDEASVITGSLGMAPSASVGEMTSLFEPIHGSYPQAAGKNIANPMGTILSAAMLLESKGLDEEAEEIYRSVTSALEIDVVTEDIKASSKMSTSNVGDWIAINIK